MERTRSPGHEMGGIRGNISFVHIHNPIAHCRAITALLYKGIFACRSDRLQQPIARQGAPGTRAPAVDYDTKAEALAEKGYPYQ
jgi:hypothetical protein